MLVRLHRARIFRVASRFARDDHQLEERSIREVAQLTGWSEANVKVRAFRARNNLRPPDPMELG